MQSVNFVAAYTASWPVWQYAYCCQNVISHRSTTASKEENRKGMEKEGEKGVKHEEKDEEQQGEG
jgi:hypothetical protein